MLCNSWIVVRKADGAAVWEIYTRAVADAINRERYDVLTAHEYLVGLNRRIREQTSAS
jgi:hypothetical protein